MYIAYKTCGLLTFPSRNWHYPDMFWPLWSYNTMFVVTIYTNTSSYITSFRSPLHQEKAASFFGFPVVVRCCRPRNRKLNLNTTKCKPIAFEGRRFAFLGISAVRHIFRMVVLDIFVASEAGNDSLGRIPTVNIIWHKWKENEPFWHDDPLPPFSFPLSRRVASQLSCRVMTCR